MMKASSSSSLGSVITLMELFCHVVLLHVPLAAGNHQGEQAHECLRPCEWPPTPRVCRYEFTLEWYYTMSTACFDCPFSQRDCHRPHCIPTNGVLRGITVVNRQFPGPSIQVCEFDTIEVKVRNEMLNDEGVGIHWHGVHLRETPHMDGTPLITQCPIRYRSNFTYQFKADTVGTHFWHAHGPQRADGAVGSLVVRQATPNDVHSNLYDYDLPEHVIIIQDWLRELFSERFASIVFRKTSVKSDSMLINGKGRFKAFTDETTNETVYTPRHTVSVQQGKRYRFRTISNAVSDCVVEISIDGHDLTIIASDGAAVEPFQVSAYGMLGGERFDFVLDANADVGKYWMRVKGLDSCRNMQELALLVYEGASGYPDPPEEEQPRPAGIVLNPFDSKTSPFLVNVNGLTATGNDAGEVREADVVLYLGLDLKYVKNHKYNHPLYYPAINADGDFQGAPSTQINRVSFKPPTAPLLTQYSNVSEFEICSYDSVMAVQDTCKVEHCECTQVLEVELGKVIEFVLVGEGEPPFAISHPMHLHGYRFHVLAHGKLPVDSTSVEEVMRLDKSGNIPRRTTNAPLKDTVAVPDGGYVVVRFVADNPGWWLFHCHVQVHLELGMSMAIHVGSDEDLPPIPRDFPRCGGDWHPKEDQTTRAPTPPNAAGARQGGIVTSFAILGFCIVSMFACVFGNFFQI